MKSRENAVLPLKQIRPNRKNARTHSAQQIRKIAASIEQFGFTNAVLVDEKNRLLAGHGRFAAAEMVGLREIPVVVIKGLSEAEKRALVLADNKLAEHAGWDTELLHAELTELLELLPAEGLDIALTGFEPAQIDGLLADAPERAPDIADEAMPEVSKTPIAQRGDLWQLGKHWLICGDARERPDYQRLLGKHRAAMVITDPPYNVKITGHVGGRGKIKHREFSFASGEMSEAQFTRFLNESLALCAAYSEDGSLHYVCMDFRHMGELLAAGRAVYSELKNVCVWCKTNAGQGSMYRSQHELVFVFKHGDAPHRNNIQLGKHGRSRSNVWHYAGVNSFRTGRMDELTCHPTVKPVTMIADAIRDCTNRGDIVLDVFMGSGTTILAAERTGRIGYGIEHDPAYVDVAIQRWQALTRRDAVHQKSGKTFDELARKRAPRRTGAQP